MIYPSSLEKLIVYLKKLPGIGEKSAERMALSILDLDNDDVDNLSDALKECKEKIKKCSVCGSLTDNDTCSVCVAAQSNTRNKNLICVLEDSKSVFAFEKAGKYDGTYHVLGGLISLSDGIGPDDINISRLLSRVEE